LKKNNIFWISFSDLMTSLFFILLVAYVITYVDLMKKNKEIIEDNEELQKKLRVYNLVEENLKPLKENTSLFQYEENYKRFTLGFRVAFGTGMYKIKDGELNNYDSTAIKIRQVGRQLQYTIDKLIYEQRNSESMASVSYLVIIAGYASHLLNGEQIDDYELSYKRAYNLWNYWRSYGIDFESDKYKDIIDLQISGNGWGGVGRFPRDPENNMENETKNQRFIIQIIPKIGKTD